MKVKKIKKNLTTWLKKISYNNTYPVNKENSPHCPNFATRCCLTCNKCWKEYNT